MESWLNGIVIFIPTNNSWLPGKIDKEMLVLSGWINLVSGQTLVNVKA